MKCPNCGSEDIKPVLEQRQVSYNECANCKYNIEWAKVESQNAKDWVESIAMEHTSLQDEAHRLEQELHDIVKPTMLQEARLSKAKRQLEAADKKMLIAEALSSIVEATESGQITLAIPELGLMQFTWGNYSVWEAIKKEME
jgi:Zn ribbon nucleic-acid-binding protein